VVAEFGHGGAIASIKRRNGLHGKFAHKSILPDGR
jgi:hypothetical protein